MLHSTNYVTRRQSLKVPTTHFFVLIWQFSHSPTMGGSYFQLLGELLLDRANFSVMTKYISEPENLKLMMNMLRDKSRNIQFEAFHVFKVRSSHILVVGEELLTD